MMNSRGDRIERGKGSFNNYLYIDCGYYWFSGLFNL